MRANNDLLGKRKHVGGFQTFYASGRGGEAIHEKDDGSKLERGYYAMSGADLDGPHSTRDHAALAWAGRRRRAQRKAEIRRPWHGVIADLVEALDAIRDARRQYLSDEREQAIAEPLRRALQDARKTLATLKEDDQS